MNKRRKKIALTNFGSWAIFTDLQEKQRRMKERQGEFFFWVSAFYKRRRHRLRTELGIQVSTLIHIKSNPSNK